MEKTNDYLVYRHMPCLPTYHNAFGNKRTSVDLRYLQGQNQ